MDKAEFPLPSTSKEISLSPERFPARLTPIESFRVPSDRLDSWKEIANHLGREVRTVQLWEKLEGLPIHRHFHKRLGSVFAFRSEVDAWRHSISRPSSGPLDPQERLAAFAAASWRRQKRAVVAVLPFESLGGASKQEFFNNGVITEIITALGRLNPERLGVISRTSVMPYKESPKRAEKLGKDLNVTHILEGTTQVEMERIRINVALVSVKDKITLWSHSYKGSLQNSFQLQTRIAAQIAQCLGEKLLSSREPVSALPPTARSASRDAYFLGRYFLKHRNQESLQKAVHYFESTIHDEPQFALAHAGLADALILLSSYEFVLPSEVMPSARRAALKALELDPYSAEAHTSFADILFHFDRDWIRADQEYQVAIRCNPGYALGYQWYANLLLAKGQHEAAHNAIMQALEIDPVSLVTIVWAGVTSHFARRYDDAMSHYRNALQMDPQFVLAHMYMAQTLEQMGDITEALLEFETTIRLSGGSSCARAMKAHAHAIAGNRTAALQIVNDLIGKPNQQQCLPSYDIAAVYVALREYGKAIAWLNRACVERNMKLFTLAQDPRFDAVRSLAEFKNLINRVGLNFTTRTVKRVAATT